MINKYDRNIPYNNLPLLPPEEDNIITIESQAMELRVTKLSDFRNLIQIFPTLAANTKLTISFYKGTMRKFPFINDSNWNLGLTDVTNNYEKNPLHNNFYSAF